MFSHQNEHTLSEYASLYDLTDLELEIIKTYMNMDEKTRRELLDEFSKLFFEYKKSLELEPIHI